jgi:CBS domain containing-hemolysin-like protein
MIHLILLLSSSFLYSLLFGLEIASASSNKIRLELDKSKSKLTNKALTFFFDNQNRFLSVLWLTSIFCFFFYILSVLSISVHVGSLYSWNNVFIFFLMAVVSVLFICILTDVVLRILFKYNPTRSFRLFVLPLYVIYLLINPFFKLYTFIFNSFGKDDSNNKWGFSINKIYLQNGIERNEDLEKAEKEKEDTEVRIFQNALDFSNVRLKNCIVPRTEITAIEINATVKELKSVFVESNYSRILVYKENIDNIVGYVHSSDMFGKPSDIKSLLNPLIVVPENMAANKLLTLFLQQQKGIALVVDEFGGTAGIITLEDVMEEIFGEIEDEHDERNEYVAKQLHQDEYLFSGRLEIQDVNEEFGLNLPVSDDYVTIAGLILSKNEILPSKNEIVSFDKYQFTILKVTSTRIELTRLKVIN